MPDFTSSLYLDFRHASRTLPGWRQLTIGAPAALRPIPGAATVAKKLAALQGCERAILAPSTLHLFWDLFGMLAKSKVAIYVDVGAYPVASWGVERAAGRGVLVRSFPHSDPEALQHRLNKDARLGLRPVVVADGFCPGCGTPPPVASYLQCLRPFGGLLILDDTQALGILGYAPGPFGPFGAAGGGVLRWSGREFAPEVLLIVSMAKGFGVPIAALSGNSFWVRSFEQNSETRVHSSPPSVAVVQAAQRALCLNQDRGRRRRARLAETVQRFRRGLRKTGLVPVGIPFPVQTFLLPPGVSASTLHQQLLRLGVCTVLHQVRGDHGPRLSFLLTARHTNREVDQAVHALRRALAHATRATTTMEVPHEWPVC